MPCAIAQATSPRGRHHKGVAPFVVCVVLLVVSFVRRGKPLRYFMSLLQSLVFGGGVVRP